MFISADISAYRIFKSQDIRIGIGLKNPISVGLCLPTCSLTTKEVTESIARLYNRALKIHSNLPKWNSTALHSLNLTLCPFKILFTVMLSHFIFYSNTAPHKHSSPSYQHITCPKCESLDLSPWPSTQCLLSITAMDRGPSSTLSPKSGMAFPITLEYYNPSHSSKKHINCYSSTHTLANTDLYVLCPCYVLYVNVTCDVPCPCMLYALQNRNLLEISYFTETGPFYIVTLLLLILSCIINKKKERISINKVSDFCPTVCLEHGMTLLT